MTLKRKNYFKLGVFVMKKNKILLCFFIAATICLASSCYRNNVRIVVKNKDAVNTIVKSKLSESEEGLINAANIGTPFIFDVNLIENKYKWLDVWIERYRKGGTKEKIIETGCSMDKTKKGLIRILASKQALDIKDNFIISIIDGKNTYTTNVLKDKQPKLPASIQVQTEKIPIFDGKEIPLAVIVENQGNKILCTYTDFFEKSEKYMDEIIKYDSVCILKCRFLKEISSH